MDSNDSTRRREASTIQALAARLEERKAARRAYAEYVRRLERDGEATTVAMAEAMVVVGD